MSDVFIVSQMLASRFPENLPMRLLGVWEPLEDSPQVWATGRIAYYICPTAHTSCGVARSHPRHDLRCAHHICAQLFSKTWIKVSGLGLRDVVKQLNDQQMVMAGHWEGSMYKELKRVIPMAVAFGGAILGLLSVAADFLVTISSGTGILMVVTIYSYCEIGIHKSSSPEMAAFGDLLDWFSFSLPFLSRTCARTYGSVRRSSAVRTASMSPLLSRYTAPSRLHDVAEEPGRLQPRERRQRERVSALECAFDFFIPSLEKRACVALMIQQHPARAHCKRTGAASLRARAGTRKHIDERRFALVHLGMYARVARPHLSLRRARVHEGFMGNSL
ncbi:SecY subunit domain-containing protein [Phellopilus nigrolimitatus]|nr:SecY subunit domain-containing protein [Phellopilus nigrolimitatus]